MPAKRMKKPIKTTRRAARPAAKVTASRKVARPKAKPRQPGPVAKATGKRKAKKSTGGVRAGREVTVAELRRMVASVAGKRSRASEDDDELTEGQAAEALWEDEGGGPD